MWGQTDKLGDRVTGAVLRRLELEIATDSPAAKPLRVMRCYSCCPRFPMFSLLALLHGTDLTSFVFHALVPWTAPLSAPTSVGR